MMNASLNTTGSPPVPGGSATVGIVILTVAFIIGFPGNTFIVWTILTRLKKKSVTCILILNLAVADGVVLLTAPFFIHFLFHMNWVFGEGICKFFHYICCVNMYASILIMTFMSLDRFLAVSKPFISQKVRTKKIVVHILIAIWFIATLLALPMPFYRKVVSKHTVHICLISHSSYKHEIFQYLMETLIGFIIPFTAIVFSYFYIGRRLQNAKFQRKRKTGKLIALIVLTFAAFWLPYHIVNIIQVLGNLTSGTTSKVLLAAAKAARPNLTALAFVSSSVNPILYAFAGSAFIKTARSNFMAKLFEGTSSEVSSIRKISRTLRDKIRNESQEWDEASEFQTSPPTAGI
ncbi:leukotriene B4 receptor 1 [Latimeria chalumnae]|uniref:Leukotriene B4 receptor n=1 Tax=Latimeria chalumnae TaxID=7897 RepID=H3AP36_LATCH|nr:PREDICTED: leukotriene B4 receptor 1 [Latimeria chalumnae]|eukprot:XP_006005384.1 PREDICTED: leukotriene B4 receptor 1 [Latimeria chalumnae]